jgi:hypothetical protein
MADKMQRRNSVGAGLAYYDLVFNIEYKESIAVYNADILLKYVR